MIDDEQSNPQVEPQGRLTTKRRISIAVGVLVVVAIVLMVVNQLVKSTAKENVSLAGSITAVEISSSGKISLTDGPLHITRHSQYVFKKPGNSAKLVDGVLKVKSDCGGIRLGDCSVNYDLALPADVPVKITNTGGAVLVRASKSDVLIATKSGAVTLENSYGRVQVETKSGAIKGTSVSSLDVAAKSESGAIDFRFAASPSAVDAETRSGAIRVSVPKSATNYNVEAASQSGRTTTEVARDASSPFKISAHSESGAVTVEAK
jgi:hypothetical protein